MAGVHQACDAGPFVTSECLRSALSQAGIVLPSFAVDAGSSTPGLVELGCVRADVAMRRAEGLRQGGEDHWRPEFCSPEPDSTRHQVDHALTVAEQYADRPLFLFVNVSATHVPHSHYTGDSWQSQAAALAYADEHLGRLVDGLAGKKRWLIIMCADHGDAFGEDGYHGRGIAHPTVLNVPFAAWLSE